MIMNNQISVDTRGFELKLFDNEVLSKETNRGIFFSRFQSRLTSTMPTKIHTGEMKIGDLTISIHFADQQEISEFCNKHNIEYTNLTATETDDLNIDKTIA
ncbi:hypothetical protein THIOSC15_2780004 [uncultured Thiomicrorhabdus sp.]